MGLPGDVAAAGGEALPERAGVRARGLHPQLLGAWVERR